METVKQELPHFVGWSKIPEGYYTKTALKRDIKLKPIDENKPDATLKAMGGGKWKIFDLYHVDNTKEIKSRKVKQLADTDRNIAESLYIINKSAKTSRDTKKSNYETRDFKVVNSSKTRQMKLYDLKDQVISKLINENRIKTIGYHEQKSFDDDINYLAMLGIEGFTFHIPITKHKTAGLEKLGEIGVIEAEKTKEISVNFYEAEKLLNQYIK